MENEKEYKSRTQIKKEAKELQKLGVKLSKLSSQELERMPIPEELKKALIEARSITSHVAGKRHRQFIGGLLRDVDIEPVHQAMIDIKINPDIESEVDTAIRTWIDRLLSDDRAAIEELIQICPGLERQRLTQIVRNAKKENTAGKSKKSLKKLQSILKKNLGND